MKIRVGFVSNSSSSSYVCNVCGEEVSGWDMGLTDAEMVECVNGHIMCETHLSNESKELLDNEEDDDEIRYSFPIKDCPVCNFEIMTDEDGFKYLLKESKKTKKIILKEIKNKFKSYKELQDYLISYKEL